MPSVHAHRPLHAVSEVTEATLAEVSRGPEHLRIIAPSRALAIGVPIIARGRLLGVITFMAAESGRRYGPAELRQAEDLAHRVAWPSTTPNFTGKRRRQTG